MDKYYLGIDVGTGSARAGIFDPQGILLASASHPIQLWHPGPEFAEQSSDDIWRACGISVRACLAQAQLAPQRIRGIGMDATCSLVALDERDRPVTVSPSGDDSRNIIVWMDHRAIEQAERITQTGHELLKYVGGKISPEMQPPKLLWLKEHLPPTWKRAARFLDLPDFLTYRATGVDTRSLCTTVCKWGYTGQRWEDAYWEQIGLGDLVKEEYRRIGTQVRPMGEPVGAGLTPEAARELGLAPGTPVGVAMIDAHAGGLGVLGCRMEGDDPAAGDFFETRLALIGGTSSCHMAVSRTSRCIPGVWGPYHHAMVPGLWLNEGGQSATGALIDHVIFSHAKADALQEEATTQGRTIYDLLNARLDGLAATHSFPALLTKDLHVLPYFHGNRSPRADPTLTGMISGLRLSDSVDDLAKLYLAAIQAVAHGTRHILLTMNEAGYDIRKIFACGGGTKNTVFLREHADITGCDILLPRESEAVLLGSAMLGAVASGDVPSLTAAMDAMTQAGAVITPSRGRVSAYHDAKHRIFHRMYEDQLAYRAFMAVDLPITV